MEFFKNQVKSFGAKSKDIPEAILLFNIGVWGIYGGLFAFCTRFQPVRTIGRTKAGEAGRRYLINWLGNRFTAFEKYVMVGAEKFGKWGIVKPIPRILNQAPKDFTLNLAETAAVYNVTFPFWFYVIGKGIGGYYHNKYKLDDEVVANKNVADAGNEGVNSQRDLCVDTAEDMSNK